MNHEDSHTDLRKFPLRSQRQILHVDKTKKNRQDAYQYDQQIVLQAPRDREKFSDKFSQNDSNIDDFDNKNTSINRQSHKDLHTYNSQQTILNKKRTLIKLSPVDLNPVIPPVKKKTGERISYQRRQEGKISVERILDPISMRLKSKIRYEEIEDHHNFTKDVISLNKVLMASLKKDDSGSKKFFPRSDLYFTEQLRYIMSSKRKACNLTSVFHFSSQIDNDINETHQSYAGTLKSNFSGSQYNIYDQNQEIIGSIFYESNCSCNQRPRSLQVYVISPSTSYEQMTEINGKKSLRQLYQIPQNYNRQKIYKLVNKKPKWNQKKGVWVLKFKGKSFLSSVKNMILVNQKRGQENEVMIIGKTDTSTFQIEAHYPLSPRIIMGIIGSSFDFKWMTQ